MKTVKINEETAEEVKETNAAFLLMLPSVLTTCLAAYYVPTIIFKLVVVVLGIYQFVMLKKFIVDYYKNR